jgi:hypothetical protein
MGGRIDGGKPVQRETARRADSSRYTLNATDQDSIRLAHGVELQGDNRLQQAKGI